MANHSHQKFSYKSFLSLDNLVKNLVETSTTQLNQLENANEQQQELGESFHLFSYKCFNSIAKLFPILNDICDRIHENNYSEIKDEEYKKLENNIYELKKNIFQIILLTKPYAPIVEPTSSITDLNYNVKRPQTG